MKQKKQTVIQSHCELLEISKNRWIIATCNNTDES